MNIFNYIELPPSYFETCQDCFWCVITLMTQKINTSSGDVISKVSNLLLLYPRRTVLYSECLFFFSVQISIKSYKYNVFVLFQVLQKKDKWDQVLIHCTLSCMGARGPLCCSLIPPQQDSGRKHDGKVRCLRQRQFNQKRKS